jgi:hypothetical protein
VSDAFGPSTPPAEEPDEPADAAGPSRITRSKGKAIRIATVSPGSGAGEDAPAIPAGHRLPTEPEGEVLSNAFYNALQMSKERNKQEKMERQRARNLSQVSRLLWLPQITVGWYHKLL